MNYTKVGQDLKKERAASKYKRNAQRNAGRRSFNGQGQQLPGSKDASPQKRN